MLFKELSLIEPLLRALETEGYEQPTPIQEQAIPIVLARQDLLGCAQTGTGKTAAFALPMLQLLASGAPKSGTRPIRALILTPTRELAIQIGESFTAYGRNLSLRNFVIFGGVGQTPQTDALRRGTDVLIATPGRLLDLMKQGYVNLRDIEIFVLDEADRMLDMGFIHDVKKVIAKLPTQRQTLFFSATMPSEISSLANSILTNPARVEVTPVSSTAEKVEQSVYFVDKHNKRHLLAHLLQDKSIRSALVFTRTKHGANKVAADVVKAGVSAEAIHGNKSQNARQQALKNFKMGRTRVLVATDIAARGIDIDELSHVVNYELPNIPETYVHRIGRTGRAGASGIAVSFCEAEELPYLKDIQKLTGQLVPVVDEHPYAADLRAPSLPTPSQAPPRGKGSRRNAAPANPPAPRMPANEREDIIPLPERKPDAMRPEQGTRSGEPERNRQDGQNGRRDQPRQQQGGGERQPQRNNDRRDGQRSSGGRDERRGPNPRREDSRPGGERRDNPNRSERRDDGNRREGQRTESSRPEPKRPPQQQQKQEPKLTREEVASAMRNRFASILEVAAIEKQVRPPKPRTDFRERNNDRNGPPKDKPFGGGGGPKRRR
ncbi:MAG: DEAD/DEAH box helicase [Saprospiraceae bacterium]|nr:DEAD/DEAH box helicase [Saprospiraceae bacterium]